MKKIITVFIALLSINILMFQVMPKIKAEGDEIEEPETQEVLEENTEETTEEEQPVINPKTKAEQWFETNLGWIVGIPLGTLFTTLIELLYLAKKSKEKIAELKQTKDFNTFAKEQLELGKEMYEKGVQLIGTCQETINVLEANVTELNGVLTAKVDDIARRLDNTDALVIDARNTFENLNGIIEANKVEIEKLQKAHLLIATHTKELVANSTAEEIVKLVKGE